MSIKNDQLYQKQNQTLKIKTKMEKVETYPKESQIVELSDTGFKRIVVNMFKKNTQDGRSLVKN